MASAAIDEGPAAPSVSTKEGLGRREDLRARIRPLPGNTLFGVYLGLAASGGLWLREPRLRALVPLSS